MFKLVNPRNGQVKAFCPVCQIEIDEKTLAPPFYEEKEEYEDEV